MALAILIVGLMTFLAVVPEVRTRAEALPPIAVDRVGRAVSALALKAFVRPDDRHGPDDVELCGAGWIEPPGQDPEAAGSMVWKAATLAALAGAMNASRTHADLAARLRADAGELAQATALVIAMADLDTSIDAPAVLPLSECVGDDCPKQAESSSTRSAQALDALARMASATSDARVYSMASKACRRSPLAGYCAQINDAQWARLDPDNAAPWMSLLDTATRARDSAGVDEALYRLGTSKRSVTGYFTTIGEVLRVSPDDDASLMAVDRMVIGLSGVEAAVSLPGYQRVINACKGDALRSANRAQACEAIAVMFTARSDTLIERSIGEAIGRNVGWPADRLERLRGARSAYSRQMQSTIGDVGRLDCHAIRDRVDTMRGVAALGEVGAMNAWIAASGRTDADFRREEQAFGAAFAKAASAALDGAAR